MENADVNTFHSNSMSHEFYQVMVGAPTMTIYGWKQLALWSLEYSCLTDTDKVMGRDILLLKWETFCEQIVHEYGSILQGDTIDETRLATLIEQRVYRN
jgi:adenosine deaminase CECR1